ncbi:PREDICTED: putative F-box protein At4g38870 [Camelina sativa]|uniref:F-box protein At4g38870 n=1 Tax=Camelina sativa TaxID=90675 RepID=A0ABM0UU87_CAMSA|nr:PREDICTED: putative F-box protein At4g38870 [Camelina sativa]
MSSDTEEDLLDLCLGLSYSSSIPEQKQLEDDPIPNPNLGCTRQFFPQSPQQQIEIGETSWRSRTKKIAAVGDDDDIAKSYTLPHELEMAIAQWFPVKTLLRSLSVSKLWRSTILSKDFRDAYLTSSLTRPQHKQGLLFTFICRDNCFVFSAPAPDYYDDEASSSSFSSSSVVATYNMTHQSISRVTISPSVHGLICYGPASGLFIYNPSTRRSIVLPSINSEYKRLNHYIGFDPVDSCYKVLCVTMGRPQVGNNFALAEELGVLTIGYGEQSWRMLEDVPPHSPTCDEMCIDGVLFFGAFTGAHLNEPAIMSFDVRSEKFRLISGPDTTAGGNYFLTSSSSKLTSYKGKLAVLLFEDQVVRKVALWVLEDAVNEEWSYKTFDLPSLLGWTTDFELQLFSATNAGEVILAPLFVRASTYRVLFYDPNKDSFRKIEIEGITDREVSHKVDGWWYCRAVSVFPGQVDTLMFL